MRVPLNCASSRYSFAVRPFDRELRFFPRFPTTWNIPKLSKSLLFQETGGDAGAITAATIHRGGFVAIELSYAIAKLRHKNVAGSGNMPLFPFPG